MGLSILCARRRPRPQAGHDFSYSVNSSFPHRNLKFNLVVSADWRTYASLTGRSCESKWSFPMSNTSVKVAVLFVLLALPAASLTD
jgi:hypothetical protein